MTEQTPGTLLSLGHGYSAQALARRLIAQGWRVIGTTRSPEKAERLRAERVEPLIWPGEALAPALAQAIEHLLDAPEERKRYAQAGLARVHSVFSWKKAARESADVYREAIHDYH